MNLCPNCNKEFHCGSNDKEPCWCSSLPNIVPLDAESCLCPDCLQKKIDELKNKKTINIQERNTVFEILAKLKSDTAPLFGKMSPQHMIEHLCLSLTFCNGKLPQVLMVDERISKAIRHHTLNTNEEFKIGFKAPMLPDEPIALIHPDLNSAITQLKKEMQDFDLYFKTNPDKTLMSPVLGELNYAEWIAFHNKHFTHHFRQFGLL